MSEGNNIDKLFKAKLAGGEAAYSAAAWSGASSMLDAHFRWLFFRKALLITIPILLVSGVGLSYLLSDTAAYSIRTESIDESPFFPEFATVSTSQTAIDSARVNPESFVKSNASIAQSESRTEYNEIQEDQLVNERVGEFEKREAAKLSQPIASTENDIADEEDSQVEYKSSIGNLNYEADINPYKHPSVSTELARIKLNNDLDYMPIVDFENKYQSGLLDSDLEKPLMNEIRKIQLFAEGGVLLARRMDRESSSQTGVGSHARLLMKYHLGESVYLDLGVGAFNRGGLPNGTWFNGSGATSVQIDPIILNYGSIVIGTGYRIGARHSLGIGFEVNPLLNVVAKKRVRDGFTDVTTDNYISDKTGFSTLDAAFIANYRLSFSERWDVTSEVHFGFIDATDNNVFSATAGADNNTLLKLGLSYRLTNR